MKLFFEHFATWQNKYFIYVTLKLILLLYNPGSFPALQFFVYME